LKIFSIFYKINMAYNGVLTQSNVTAGYIDLATAWKMEG
jgi:hypothetical protein